MAGFKKQMKLIDVLKRQKVMQNARLEGKQGKRWIYSELLNEDKRSSLNFTHLKKKKNELKLVDCFSKELMAGYSPIRKWKLKRDTCLLVQTQPVERIIIVAV